MRRDTARARAAQSDPAYDLSPSGKTVLQERLTTYGLVTFAVAVSYWPAFFLTWRGHPGVSDAMVSAHVFSPWTFVLLGLHLSLWLLARGGPIPARALPVIDVVFHAGVGGVFGAIVRSHPAPVIAPLEGVLALAAVLGARSLIVPSSGARTAKSWDAEHAEGWWREHTQAVAERRSSMGRTGSSLGRSVLVDRSRHEAEAAISDTVQALAGEGARLGS